MVLDCWDGNEKEAVAKLAVAGSGAAVKRLRMGIKDSKFMHACACRQQTVEDFLDEDEKEAAAKSAVAVAPEFDTFGSTAAERARQAADAEAADRSKESIPGLLPAELLAPVADSIGESP